MAGLNDALRYVQGDKVGCTTHYVSPEEDGEWVTVYHTGQGDVVKPDTFGARLRALWEGLPKEMKRRVVSVYISEDDWCDLGTNMSTFDEYDVDFFCSSGVSPGHVRWTFEYLDGIQSWP